MIVIPALPACHSRMHKLSFPHSQTVIPEAPHTVIPECLAWFINQSPAQGYLHNLARRGTHMPVVPKSAFENLQVNIPDIKTQEKIVKLNSLAKTEKALLNNIQGKRTLLIRSLCLKAAICEAKHQ